ncbi:hypothetical protein ASPCAL08443 [Aspergillus calidoustus]|uniref:Uncharacterized protein n=1 Tax=Aspergillus calidoustus TaxID=454130 RepID=A0A0U5GWV1_ASPCI|nr:hypothetical protein ASPCAL08443 [Aspergillus calidoustus]
MYAIHLILIISFVCAGLVYSNQCRDTAGEDCCLNRECSTDAGNGYCRNRNNQTCEGEYVVGSGPTYPCPGPTYIVCCVRWEDMVNETDTSSSSTSSQTTLTPSSSSSFVPSSSSTTDGSSPTETGSSSSDSNSSSGLTVSQKGGIAGGIVGAVAVTSLVFVLVWWMRRRRRLLGKGENVGDGDGDGDGGDNRAVTETAVGAMTGTGSVERGREDEEDKGAAMLASREKQELDGSGRALHEMDSETAMTPTTPTGNEKGAPETKVRRMAELPGSLAAIAEMPVPEERRG